MKDRIFWILLVGVGLAGWNVAFAQRQMRRLDLIVAEPTATKASEADALHVMDADGRNLRPFVSCPEYTSHGSPAWSCDGSQLAFDAWRSVHGETYVDAHIFACSADGTHLKDLGVGAMPSWSPDGNRIVFSNYNPRGVWIMNADGTNRQLRNADGWGAEWCPRGEVIAYTVSAAGANIAVLNLATGATTTLLDDRYATVFWGMAWSPDGQWIAFKGQTRDGTTELAVVHVERHRQGFRVLLPAAIPDMTDLLHNPSWNPDGKQIIAAVITKANPARQLYLLDVAGNEPAKLLPGLEHDRWYNDMAWSPDGTRIVVSTRQTAVGPAVQWLNAPLEQPSVPAQPIYSPILPAVPAQPTVAPAADLLPSDARELVSRYEQEKARIKTAAVGQLRDRHQQLIEELTPLQDKYTREARLDEAVAIRDVIRALTPPVVSSLPDSGSLFNHSSRVGGVLYFRVTGRLDGSVWGTDAYTSDSVLATTAVHAGILRPGQTGVVKVTILPGQAAYPGSARNGVRSMSYGPYPGSYKVEPADAEAVEFFYAPQNTDDQTAPSSGEQDPMDVPHGKASTLERAKAAGVTAVTAEVQLVALHEELLKRAVSDVAAEDSGPDRDGGALAPLGQIGAAVLLKPLQSNKLLEMARNDRISTLQAPIKLVLLSGWEGKIADFGGRSGELRLRPVVSADRKSIQMDLSYRRPSDAGSPISTTQIIPVGSVLAVSIAETVYEGRSEKKTPILGDLPYLNRYFRNIGIGRGRIVFVLILTPQLVTEQQDKMPVTAWPVAAFDGFDGRLDLPWKPIRHDPTHVSLDKHRGKLTIITQRGSIHGDEKNDTYGGGIQAKNIFVIDNPLCNGEDFAMTTCIENFIPQMQYQQAGLICYDDDDNYLKWGYEWNWHAGAGHTFTYVREINQQSNFDVVDAKPGISRLWLRIVKRANTYQYSYSYDGEQYVVVGEQTWGGGKPKKLGILAKNGGNPDASELECQFDFFQLMNPGEENSCNWDNTD